MTGPSIENQSMLMRTRSNSFIKILLSKDLKVHLNSVLSCFRQLKVTLHQKSPSSLICPPPPPISLFKPPTPQHARSRRLITTEHMYSNYNLASAAYYRFTAPGLFYTNICKCKSGLNIGVSSWLQGIFGHLQ